MGALDARYADALRECDALSASADSLVELEADTESICEAYAKLARFAAKWAHRVFGLCMSLKTNGHYVALPDLEMYGGEFGKFIEYARECSKVRGCVIADADLRGDTDNDE